jgi:uncharacterized protein YceK
VRALIVLLLVVASGCAQVAIRRASGPVGEKETEQASVLSISHHRMFWGLVPLTAPASLEPSCPGARWVRVETLVRGAQVPFLILTAGIYSPWTTRISCLK